VHGIFREDSVDFEVMLQYVNASGLLSDAKCGVAWGFHTYRSLISGTAK